MKEKALIWRDESTELWREVDDNGVVIYRLITAATATAAATTAIRKIEGELCVKKEVTLTIK